MTRHELERTADVFTIELLDMQRHHRVLFGEDVLQGLHIPMDLHRVQVEYELREKLVLLRQQILLASENESRLWDLAVALGIVVRHSLSPRADRARPGAARHTASAKPCRHLAQRLGFDASRDPEASSMSARTKSERQEDRRSRISHRTLSGGGRESQRAAVDTALESRTLGS